MLMEREDWDSQGEQGDPGGGALSEITISMSHISNKFFKVWTPPVVLLFLSVLSYALLIPWLGFYGDDWAGVWVGHSLGGPGLREYASLSRPFEGWVFSWSTALLGETPLHWHLFALLTRWLS